MARRIKEEPIVHQNRIAEQAMLLFAKKGIENTKMDEIANLAGYSKATIYVYFKNKDDIVSFLALQSMMKLRDSIKAAVMQGKDVISQGKAAVSQGLDAVLQGLAAVSQRRDAAPRAGALSAKTAKESFFKICNSLVDYQRDYPDFFAMSLKYINVKCDGLNQWDSQSYQVGEEINRLMYEYLEEGIQSGIFKSTDSFFETILLMWGMISGIITLAAEKEEYLLLEGKITKDKFLQDGFERIYSSICVKSY